MTVTCLAFSGVIAEDGLDTQELSVGPTAPIAGKADADLSGTPAGSTKIAAFDLTITATADMAGAGSALAVAVSEEASLKPIQTGRRSSCGRRCTTGSRSPEGLMSITAPVGTATVTLDRANKAGMTALYTWIPSYYGI